MSKKNLSKFKIIYYIVGIILSFMLIFIYFYYLSNFSNKKKINIPSKQQQSSETKKLTDFTDKNNTNKNNEIFTPSNSEEIFTPSNSEKFLSFKDLIGLKEEKEALDGFIDYLQNKNNYIGIGKVEPPLGILFYGVPGTGKTTLARAVAKETELPFFEVASSLFSQKYIGVAPKMVRDLFENARKKAKENNKGAIIFLDECETIFTTISTDSAESREDNHIVNQFKTEITSINNDPNNPIFIIGATNHYEQIDEAIKSRFTYHIEIKPGNKADRKKFLEEMIKKRQNPYDDDAKAYLLKDINDRLDDFKDNQEYLKTNRTLENLLKTIASVFARNRKKVEETSILKLRNKINKDDIEKAYQIVIGKKNS